MDIISYTEKINTNNATLNKYFTNDVVLFDIECLGLSSLKYPIYLIGCAKRNNDDAIISLFFAENINEEKELLISFEEYISDKNTLMSFNGANFDEPFIVERCKKLEISTSIREKTHIDLYRRILKAKSLLNLNNYKQKTIEEFMGLFREDKYDGGKLINVYKEYIKNKDQNLKDLLILHNYEDVKGMLKVIEALAYIDFLDCDITDISSECNNEKYDLLSKSNINLPILINKINEQYTLLAKNDNISLSFPIIEDELFLFIKDHNSYVHLISEDIVIPKELASSLDKSSYDKATKENCRIKTTAQFIKINKNIELSESIHKFKYNYADKSVYIKIDELDTITQKNIIKFYIKH